MFHIMSDSSYFLIILNVRLHLRIIIMHLLFKILIFLHKYISI